MLLTIWITLNIYHTYAERWINNDEIGKSYFVNIGAATWLEAQSACGARNASLAVITQHNDTNFIANLQERSNELNWIGLVRGNKICSCLGIESTDECKECRESWNWDDGTAMHYLNWANQRPFDDLDGAVRACGVIRSDGRAWDAASCNINNRFICQHDCSPNLCMRSDCDWGGIVYKCLCNEGFTGQHCDQDIDECLSIPCLHGATCVNEVNHYICQCKEGFTGSNCETDINKCESQPCESEKICRDLVNGFECVCSEEYTGENCDETITDSKKTNSECPDISGYIGGVIAAVAVAVILTTIGNAFVWRKYYQNREKNNPNAETPRIANEANSPVSSNAIQLYETLNGTSDQYENSYSVLNS